MRVISILLTTLLLFSWIAASRYAYVCVILKKCDGVLQAQPSPPSSPRAKNLSLKYNNDMIMEGKEAFEFNDKKVVPNLSSDNIAFLDEFAQYLKNNRKVEVEVYGAYKNDEALIKSGVFENLGLARANAIRQELVKRGIAENRIALNYEKSNEKASKSPIRIKLTGPRQAKTEKDFTRVLFTFENMTFSDANFAVDSDNFKPGDQFLNYADSMAVFLENNPSYKVKIIGHTDDDGNPGYNKSLGMKRAISAKQFLENKKVKAPISTFSMGETQPMAPNDTDANKQKNRRVNFVIEK